GQWLHQSAHGIDERPVQTNSEPVSISRETTFERNLHAKRDRDALGQIFTTLCERLADDLVRKAVAAQTVGIKLRDDRFKTITRDLSLEVPIRHAADIRYYAGQTLKRAPLDRPLRLLGVKLGKLVPLSALPSQAQTSRRVAETGDLFT
ncbi:MAG: DNA polymerase IV, partial [Burkholderiaceae bacterium]